MRYNIGKFVGEEFGMAAEGIDGLGQSTRSLAVDFFAIHLGIANQVLRKHLLKFFPFTILEKLLYFYINFRHLDDVFA